MQSRTCMPAPKFISKTKVWKRSPRMLRSKLSKNLSRCTLDRALATFKRLASASQWGSRPRKVKNRSELVLIRCIRLHSNQMIKPFNSRWSTRITTSCSFNSSKMTRKYLKTLNSFKPCRSSTDSCTMEVRAPTPWTNSKMSKTTKKKRIVSAQEVSQPIPLMHA